MRIPAILSTVHVAIDANGHLAVDVNGVPRSTAHEWTRGDLRPVLDEITTSLGTAVRVEVREHDGTTYSDISVPPPTVPSPPAARSASPSATPPAALAGLSGTGFRPGEEVAIAYVVYTQTAGIDGCTTVQIPPALLVRSGRKMLLVGMTSAVVAEVEPT